MSMLSEGDFQNIHDYTNYLCQLRQEFEQLSSGHIRWHTHKNPYGCWICDVFRLLIMWEGLYYPSPPKNVMNKDLGELKSEQEGVIKSDS